MPETWGADPGRLRELAEGFKEASRRLFEMSNEVTGSMAGDVWRGPDGTSMSKDVLRGVGVELKMRGLELDNLAEDLRRQAGQQSAASVGEESPAQAVRGATSPTPPGPDESIAARNRTNRLDLDAYLAEIQSHSNLSREELRRIELLQQLTAQGHPPGRWSTAQVLEFDPKGDGLLVVSIGDLSAARNVAVMVPGIGTEMSGVRDMLGDAEQIRDGDDRTAVIAWLGYDSPAGTGDLSRLSDFPSGAGEHRAAQGATRLRDFLGGLDLQDQHVSVLGHSYGSIVTMRAAEGGGLPMADNIVTLGSPGSEIYNSISDLELSPGQNFYALAADKDIVAGAFGDIVPGHARGPHPALWTFGPSGFVADAMLTSRTPTDPGFGGKHLETDAWGSATKDSTGHSAYYAPGTGGLENVRAVVTGGATHPRSAQWDDVMSYPRGVFGETREFLE